MHIKDSSCRMKPSSLSGKQHKIDPMFVQCWATVYDDRPTLNKHRICLSCLFGDVYKCNVNSLGNLVMHYAKDVWGQIKDKWMQDGHDDVTVTLNLKRMRDISRFSSSWQESVWHAITNRQLNRSFRTLTTSSFVWTSCTETMWYLIFLVRGLMFVAIQLINMLHWRC